MTLLAGICLMAGACAAPKQTDPDLLYAQSFEDLAELPSTVWLVEGTGSAQIVDGQLELREEPDGVGVVAWLREDLTPDFRLSFDVGFSNNRGIGVFFFASTGPDQSDVLRASRTGAYDEYIRGDVHGYSLSLHRYWPDGRNNPGSNVRRNPDFHLLSQATLDPVLDANRMYRVEISKLGPRIVVDVDGRVVHDVVDGGEFGEPWQGGKIGFRLRGDTSCAMVVDNIRIVSLP